MIDPDGQQVGILTRAEALELAKKHSLDLVEVAAKSNPPVCRIMDYGKFKYQQSKKTQEARKKQTFIQVKEVKIRAKTEEHDLQIKVKAARKFLEKGFKVKVSLMFRGREIAHPELAQKIFTRFAEGIEDIGVVESHPRLEGRLMVMIVAAKSQ